MNPRTWTCGCVAINNALDPCKVHSERNPPAGWKPETSRPQRRQKLAVQAQALGLDARPPAADPEPPYPDLGPQPAHVGRFLWTDNDGLVKHPGSKQ